MGHLTNGQESAILIYVMRRFASFSLGFRRWGWQCLALLTGLVCLSAPAPAAWKEPLYVQPGDVLDILIPRYEQYSHEYSVDADGAIALDVLGAVKVEGLTPKQVAALLEERLREYLREPSGIVVHIRPRTKTIRVLGHVARPGLYQVSQAAGVQEVLAEAGGVLTGAILTEITLRRRVGLWVEEIPVNLKAFLEQRQPLPELRDGDEVFVPKAPQPGVLQPPPGEGLPGLAGGERVGVVSVLGEVVRPGEYEVGEQATLISVLVQAGGPKPTADLRRVRLVHAQENNWVEVFDLQGYLEGRGSTPPRVREGDVIFLPGREVETIEVQVLGYVREPGHLQLPADASLQEALNRAGGALEGADLTNIRLLRRHNGGLLRQTINLERFLVEGGAENLPALADGDLLFVPKPTVPVTPTATVYVLGEVRSPGAYALPPQRSLLHLLAQAGGATPEANLERVKIVHETPEGQQVVYYNLAAYLQGNREEELPELRDGDTITVERNVVTVLGAVAVPGQHAVPTGSTLVDVLVRAGGPTPTADLTQIQLTRAGPEGERTTTVNLEAYVSGQGELPLLGVKAGDVILVPQAPAEQRQIFVLGEVSRPGVYDLGLAEASVLYALALAGGATPEGDLQRVQIFRSGEGGGRIQLVNVAAHLNGTAAEPLPVVQPGDVITVLPRLVGGLVTVLGEVNRPGTYPVREGDDLWTVVQRAGGLRAGSAGQVRITRRTPEGEHTFEFDLAGYLAGEQTVPLPKVEPGDLLSVGGSTIYVLGEVMGPGLRTIAEGTPVTEVLARMGGVSPRGDASRIQIVRAGEDARPRVIEFNYQRYLRGQTDVEPPRLYQGDTLIVPPAKERRNLWRQILEVLATGALLLRALR
ncbi:MAG TPA: hypothetical protein EYP85_16755 [Armatimonadetes bacterium]|nr:hypothetical protein [Armatimonadota bacterium]